MPENIRKSVAEQSIPEVQKGVSKWALGLIPVGLFVLGTLLDVGYANTHCQHVTEVSSVPINYTACEGFVYYSQNIDGQITRWGIKIGSNVVYRENRQWHIGLKRPINSGS